MRKPSRLTVFTLTDGSTITTRSALEARWAIFFNEIRLSWKYEPCGIGNYLPDFRVEGLGFVEIKPTLDLLISETSERIRLAAPLTHEDIFVFVGGQVSFNTVAIYQGKQIVAPTPKEMVDIFGNFSGVRGLVAEIFCSTSMIRANRAKLDHFLSIGKILEGMTAQRKIVMVGI